MHFAVGQKLPFGSFLLYFQVEVEVFGIDRIRSVFVLLLGIAGE